MHWSDTRIGYWLRNWQKRWIGYRSNEANPGFQYSHLNSMFGTLVMSPNCSTDSMPVSKQSNMEWAERTPCSSVKYFKLDTPTSPTAKCNICNMNISRGGDNVAKYNTTNLNKHLQRHHAIEHAELLKTMQENTTKQLILVDSLQRRDKLPARSVKATNITEVMEFIVLDLQPLYVVENEGFCRLVEHFELKYSLPSRKCFSETALPELYKKVCKHISEKLKYVTSMSFTTDIWSSDVGVCPMTLLSLTVHWLDTSCSPHSAMLQAKNFHGSHTGDTISAAIKEMLHQWHILLTKVHAILRDNASNMKKAMDTVHSLGCFAHTLQLVVNEGLLSLRSVSNAIASCRQTVGHFKHSPLAYSRRHDIQLQMQMQPKRLQKDILTRWISTYYMIESSGAQASPCFCLLLPMLLIKTCPRHWQSASGLCWKKLWMWIHCLRCWCHSSCHRPQAHPGLRKMRPILELKQWKRPCYKLSTNDSALWKMNPCTHLPPCWFRDIKTNEIINLLILHYRIFISLHSNTLLCANLNVISCHYVLYI